MGARPDWSSLPWDTLSLILQRLPWSSHPSFASVCSHWRSAVSPFYPAWLTPLLFSAIDVGSTNLRYYSPYFGKNFEVDNTLELPGGAAVCGAAGEHLILRWGNMVLDAQLLRGVIHRSLPPVDHIRSFQFVAHDGARRVFLVDALHYYSTTIYSVPLCIMRSIRNDHGGWEGWDEPPIAGPRLAASLGSNPVLHDGMVYLLGEYGEVAVYDERAHDEGFRVLDKPKSFGLEYCKDSYLVASDQGELMAVLVGDQRSPVHVVRLVEDTMEWEKMESLQGRTLFTGTLTTLMKKTDVKWMQDRVFLPVFHDWPETIHANLVCRGGEFAFVPKSLDTDTVMAVKDRADNVATMWSYQLGQDQEASRVSTADRLSCDMTWVDFSNN